MSNSFGPFGVRPGILERSTNLVDLVVRQRPGTEAFRLWVAPTLEDAYGTLAASGLAGTGGTMLMEVRAGGIEQTRGVVRRGLKVEECRRGSTSFQVDPADIAGCHDDQFFYARLQEQRAGAWMRVPAGAPLNGNYPLRGPILIVPNPQFLFASASVLSMQSLAPLATGCAGGQLPVVDQTVQTPLPLHIVLPRPAATVEIRNISAAGDPLLVSFGLEMPMMELDAGDSSIPTGGGYAQPGVREIVVAAGPGAGAVVPFIIQATIGLELI